MQRSYHFQNDKIEADGFASFLRSVCEKSADGRLRWMEDSFGFTPKDESPSWWRKLKSFGFKSQVAEPKQIDASVSADSEEVQRFTQNANAYLALEFASKTSSSIEIQVRLVLARYPDQAIDITEIGPEGGEQPATQMRNGRFDVRMTVDYAAASSQGKSDHEVFAQIMDGMVKDAEVHLNLIKRHMFQLALSGGGFRATLYHLGVVKALRDMGLLNSIQTVSAVSGGSILAGHMMAYWSDYSSVSESQFECRVKDLISLVQSDLRRKVMLESAIVALAFGLCLRLAMVVTPAWVDFAPIVGLLGTALPLSLISGRMVTWLARKSLDQLYGGITLKNARHKSRRDTTAGGAPNFCFNTTSMGRATLAAFTASGYIRDYINHAGVIAERTYFRSDEVKLSKAVMASSAFPVLFAPVSHTVIEEGGMMRKTSHEALADGGIFDNTGLAVLQHAAEWDESLTLPPQNNSLILASDAVSGMILNTHKRYNWFPLRLSRAIAIMMESQTKARFGTEANLIQIHIERAGLINGHEARCLRANDALSIPTALATVRTDLDRFSPLTIRGLVLHGYINCMAAIMEHASKPSSDEATGANWLKKAQKAINTMHWFQGIDTGHDLPQEGLAAKIAQDGWSLTPVGSVLREIWGFTRLLLTAWPLGIAFLLLLGLHAYPLPLSRLIEWIRHLEI